ncbi:MAG: FHA domain-containing protein [Lachnospiraceae bacterium]|nr:FHA domain-containing protein [Lachnospiraceae bacterium]
MNMVKVCPKCKQNNQASADVCRSCGFNLIMVAPALIDESAYSEERYLICPVCRAKNPLGKGQSAGDIRYCRACDQDDIRNATEDDIKYERAEGFQNPAGETVQETGDAGTVLKLVNEKEKRCISINEGEHIIGKEGDVDAEYFSTCRYVSREHAHISVEKHSIRVKDSSTNGTRVNDRTLRPGEWVELKNGDRICFADITFEVSLC